MHSNKRIYIFIVLLLGLFALSGFMMVAKYNSSEYDPSAYDSFASLRLTPPPKKMLPDISLYTDESGNRYFFLPSCASLSDYVFSIEEIFPFGKNKILIDGEPIHNKDSLEKYELETPYTVTFCTNTDEMQCTITFMQSQNLPAIFISTVSGTIDDINASKEYKEAGNFVCINADGSVDSSGSLASVKAHGSFSFIEVNKKSYQITFDTATDVLSMGAANKYILQANAYDDTYLRNKLVYDYCKDFGMSYTVDAEYADLYFNGEYAGNYLLLEKVELNKNRIDISNGYLLEQTLHSRIEDGDQVFQVSDLNEFLIKNPSPISEEELQSLTDYMNTVENLIQDCDSDEKYTALQEYIDIASFADMYLVNAVTNDIDSNIASTFYYKKEDPDDTKLYAGPVWDYDNAWGRAERGFVYDLDAYPTGLCEELFANAQFQETVTAKYNDTAYPLIKKYITEKIPLYTEQIAASIAMDSARWQTDGYHSGYYTDYESAVSYLEDYICKRTDYLYDRLNHPEKYHRVLFVNDSSRNSYRDTEYWVKDGETIPDEVLEEVKIHFSCEDFTDENGLPYQNQEPVFEDMTIYKAQ